MRIATGMNDVPEPTPWTLKQRLLACKEAGMPGLPVPELLRFMTELATTLDALHAKGRNHGNVNPASIHLLGKGIQLSEPNQKMTMHDGSAAISITPNNTPPEVWQLRQVPEGDQYSLACTYVELRSGDPVFTNMTILESMQAHRETTPDLSRFADSEGQVLLRALAKNYRKRYGSCGVFVKALRKAIIAGG